MEEEVTAPRRLTILGAGSWGTALSIALAPRFEEIVLWAHTAERAEQIAAARENETYLPGFRLPENVTVSPRLDLAPWVLAVLPSRYFRSTMQQVAAAASGPLRLISATKGIEPGRFLRMSEVAEECLAGRLGGPVAALSGPTFAREIAQGDPAAIVVASPDAAFNQLLQVTLGGGNLRFYTNQDLLGVELCGALKNIVAIAAGAGEGLGLGSNAMAALVTRGLAEIGRLVAAMGGQPNTVAGLAGLGDLVLTCTGKLSRNRRVGMELARGRSLAEVLADSTMVAEGVDTAPAALALANSKGVEMPIVGAVAAMLAGRDPRDILRQLLDRAPRAEDAAISTSSRTA